MPCGLDVRNKYETVQNLKDTLLKCGYNNLVHPETHICIKAAYACTDSGNYRVLFQKNIMFIQYKHGNCHYLTIYTVISIMHNKGTAHEN